MRVKNSQLKQHNYRFLHDFYVDAISLSLSKTIYVSKNFNLLEHHSLWSHMETIANWIGLITTGQSNSTTYYT